MQLYSYFRSSASYRVRIALALKGLQADYLAVHLAKSEQLAPAYAAVSASRLVPTLVDGPAALTQSLAIIEFLDETHPQPPLLPRTALERAHVRALALDIACEIHPLNNLRVLRYLTQELKVSEDDKNCWYQHWVETGLAAIEQRLERQAQLEPKSQPADFCHGNTPTLADCVLVPQIFNAQRFNCRLDHVPLLMRVHQNCMQLDAFSSTRPEACPDAE